ncbi:hypothetical protein H1R20_g3087, partial [Candolleomyces eurysporus]
MDCKRSVSMSTLKQTLSDISQNPPFTQAPRLTPHDLKVTGMPVQCPSDFWLKHPGWIDHVANPPHYYVSIQEIEEALAIWGPITGIQQETAPEPCPLAPPLPCSPLDHDYEMDQAMACTLPTPVPGADAIMSLQQSKDTQRVLGGAPASTGVLPVDPSLPVHVLISSTIQMRLPGAKPSKKSQSTVKIFTINICNADHVKFIKAGLQAHVLDHAFSPGLVSGPPIKLYWTGSVGGKTNAVSVLKDEDFNINKQAIFRKKSKPEVTMEFSANDLEPFHIQETIAQALADGLTDENQELAYGTHVPQVSSFNTSSQMHGLYILELKKKWKCEKHLGEHNNSGYCYVSADGTHIWLNAYRLKLWAAAWAAGDVTKHELPNIDAFDGDHTATGPPVKPQGRGQCSSVSAASGTTSGNDLVAMLTSAHLQEHQLLGYPHPCPLFPLLAMSSMLALPLFFAKEGIDFLSYETAFSNLDLTPDFIVIATDCLLTELLQASIGKVLKLKLFCEGWAVQQAKKKDVFM